MKRSADTLDTVGRGKSGRRQDPVSCQLCRTKKLKCDRQTPCSNCRSRKTVCVSATGASQTDSVTGPSTLGGPMLIQTTSDSIEDLKSRLARLEELITPKTTADASLPIAHRHSTVEIDSTPRKEDQSRDDEELSKTAVWMEAEAFQYRPSAPETPSNQFTPDDEFSNSFSAAFMSFIMPLTSSRMDLQHISSMLPPRAQGEVLLEYFFDEVCWIYHIVHIPTVWCVFDNVYTALKHNTLPKYDGLALISTIFALSAYFGSPSSTIYFRQAEGKMYSYRWTVLAQGALSAADYINAPTLETIQSIILMSQHILPNIGAIGAFKTMLSIASQSARELAIHQIDSPANKKRRENTEAVDWVEVELKRRIWWQLTSVEWIFSYMSGTQYGTYSIHPKQMNVDLPTNVNDADIGNHGDYGEPMSVPTDMSYAIYRHKLSVTIRQIIDSISEAGVELEDMPYDMVLDYDKKFQDFMRNNPFYFQPDPQSRLKSESIDKKMPFIVYQRVFGQIGLHTRIARLHRAYLARGAHDPRYAYSRMVCLRSARMVLELGRELMTTGHGFEAVRVWTVTHHLYMCTMILVMDFHFNRDDPQTTQRKEEIMNCLRMLKRSQVESTIVKQGLKQLLEFLNCRKWRTNPDVQAGADPSSPILENTNTAMVKAVQPSSQDAHIQQGPSHNATEVTLGSHFGNRTAAFGGYGPNPDHAHQWSNIDDSLLDYFNTDHSIDGPDWEILFHTADGFRGHNPTLY